MKVRREKKPEGKEGPRSQMKTDIHPPQIERMKEEKIKIVGLNLEKAFENDFSRLIGLISAKISEPQALQASHQLP